MKSLTELLTEIEKRASEATESWNDVDIYVCGGNTSVEKVRPFVFDCKSDVPALLAVIRKLIQIGDDMFDLSLIDPESAKKAKILRDKILAQILAGEKV